MPTTDQSQICPPVTAREQWLTIAVRHHANALDYQLLADDPDATATEREYAARMAAGENERKRVARQHADDCS